MGKLSAAAHRQSTESLSTAYQEGYVTEAERAGALCSCVCCKAGDEPALDL